MLPFNTREDSGILVVIVNDPAGFSGLRDPLLRDTVYTLIPDSDEPQMVLDLERADYLSSSGIAILIGLKRRIEERGGKLVLCNVSPVVHELLSMMNLAQLFRIVDDQNAALASIRPLPTA